MAARDGPWDVAQTLTPSDGSAGDFFGTSIALGGNTALVGADLDDDNGTGSGSVYVFERASDGRWRETQKLTASDGDAGDRFGFDTALSGSTAIVGAFRDDDNGDGSGAAYVFERRGGRWRETQKLTASDGDADDWFGYVVTLDGGTAIVTAIADDEGIFSGSAYVFERGRGGWRETQKLTPPDGPGLDPLGGSAALAGNTAFIGAIGDDDNGAVSGAMHVFERRGTDWTHAAKLLPADGAERDQFGYSPVVGGSTAIIGANLDDDNGDRSGSAYVFERRRDGWVETQKLTASDGDADDSYGFRIALSGSTAIVGALWDDDVGPLAGSAYVLEKRGGRWTEVQKLTPIGGGAPEFFSASIALRSDTALVGAPGSDAQGVDSGEVWVFER